jgi:non-specific serine/threonine protein kinase
MGEVYLARDTRLDREVALKLLPADLAGDPERLARFRQEALTLAALNHPNIATIYGFEEPEPGTLFLALEFVEGETLHDRVVRKPPTVEEAMQIGAQIAEALEAAHERGIVHRDLKPKNVMIGPRGLVKVLDFGLARARGKSGTSGGRSAGAGHAAMPKGPIDPSATVDPDATLVSDATMAPIGDETVAESSGGGIEGTPGYMSPEQVRGAAQDERTDLFAFGCVLYECLAGRRAFLGEDLFQTLTATLENDPDFSALPARTPGRVRDLLFKLLEKDPAKRLAVTREARHELEEALGIRRAAALRAGEAAATTPHNLPKSLTRFVGRDEEVKSCGLKLAEHRLLTLTGMGGTGKTRLALETAERALADFPDGVWFVDLAPVTDPSRVETSVAAAVGVREEPGLALVESLLSHLRGRRALLVLDNCEELRRACAGLAATVLHACPDVKILATSREALETPGEVVHSVGTLATPPARGASSAAAVGRYDAVRLFVERAKAAVATFDLTDANARAVADVCRSLDGIPLALELAAARVKLLSIDQIRAKLDDRFRLLTASSKSGLTRHQTLRATIQWSYDQLEESERALLHRFAVFLGGWTLEAACAVAGEGADEFEILDALTRLVDRSLVVVAPGAGGASRYRFLESVRQFALERLREAGDENDARERHARFFATLAESAESKLTGPEQGAWFERLTDDHENLLAALSWPGAHGEGAVRGVRMAAALARFWTVRGHYELGRRALEEALDRNGAATPNEARATALVRLSAVALYQGDYAAARPRVEEALALCRALGDERGEVRAIGTLGTVALYQGDLEAARQSFEEGLALYRKQKNERGAALALHNLGSADLQTGRYKEALGRYEEALTFFRRIGDRTSASLTQGDLALTWVRLGEPEKAREPLAASLETVGELVAKREAAYGLEAAAEFLLETSHAREGALCFGAAAALREEIGSPRAPFEKPEWEELQTRLAKTLGPQGLESALREAAPWPFEDVIAKARAWVSSV